MIKIKGDVVIDNEENLTLHGDTHQLDGTTTIGDNLFVGGTTSIGGNVQVAGQITIGSHSYFNGRYLYGDNKEMIDHGDNWLRLNQNGDFSSGTFANNHFKVGGTSYLAGAVSMGSTHNGYQAYVPVGDFSKTDITWTSGKDITGLNHVTFYCFGTSYAGACHYQCARATPTSSWKCYGTGENNWATPQFPQDGGTPANGTTYCLACKSAYFRHEVEFSNSGNTIKTREDNIGIRSETSWLAWRN